MKKYIRKKQAKEKYDISYTTLSRWVKTKKIETAFDGFLLKEEDIVKCIEENAGKAGQPIGSKK